MRDRPDELRQIARAERMSRAKEDLLELGLLERSDDASGMAEEMDVERLSEVLFRAGEDRRIESIGRCLVDQNPIAERRLDLPVKSSDAPILRARLLDTEASRIGGAAVKLHQGA